MPTTSLKDPSNTEGSWDRVVSLLDNHTIRNTLSGFPSDSPLTQSGDSEVDTDNERESNHSGLWNSKKLVKDRYDPGFIIPLMFCALQFEAPMDLGKEHQGGDDKGLSKDSTFAAVQEPGSTKSFVVVAQRLCAKGGLALCLAALCCECHDLRRVAIATLGLITQAIDSEKGRDETSWRDRPQLSLLLSSVRRGLLLRSTRYHRDSDGDVTMEPASTVAHVDDQPRPASSRVPKLSPLAAVFLAKASLVLSQPDDALYGAMNRYFLKLDSAHGAFDDFNRLPAFISLFCSASEDSEIDRRERMWSVETLRDSCLNESCYRMVASCHAPEMILSTLGALPSRRFENQQRDKEAELLLEALTSLLRNGGTQVTYHLLVKLGFLSWLSAFIGSSGPTSDAVLASDQNRIAVFRLACAAIEASDRLGRVDVTDGTSISEEPASTRDLLAFTEGWNFAVSLLEFVLACFADIDSSHHSYGVDIHGDVPVDKDDDGNNNNNKSKNTDDDDDPSHDDYHDANNSKKVDSNTNGMVPPVQWMEAAFVAVCAAFESSEQTRKAIRSSSNIPAAVPVPKCFRLLRIAPNSTKRRLSRALCGLATSISEVSESTRDNEQRARLIDGYCCLLFESFGMEELSENEMQRLLRHTQSYLEATAAPEPDEEQQGQGQRQRKQATVVWSDNLGKRFLSLRRVCSRRESTWQAWTDWLAVYCRHLRSARVTDMESTTDTNYDTRTVLNRLDRSLNGASEQR